MVGVGCAATQTLLSGFASVFFERVLKSKAQHFSVWERNIQLAVVSSVIYAPAAVFETGRRSFVPHVTDSLLTSC